MSGIKYKYIITDTPETKISEFQNRKELLKDLTKLINSDYVTKLHSKLDNCYNDSIYNNSIKTVDENGNKIVIIKNNSNIFKANGGFICPSRSRLYLNDNKQSLYWYSNKYMVYSLNASIWGGINVLRTTNELKLFDYFDKDNIEKLINFIKEYYPDNSDKYIENIKYITGYELTLANHKNLIKKKSGWVEIWTMDKINTKYSLSHECNIKKEADIMPVFYGVRYHYYLETVIMKDIYLNFLKKYNLDGFIKKSIYTAFADIDGIYHEEIILPGYTILNKTVENLKHPLYWINWNLPFNLPKTGLIMNSGLPTACGNIHFNQIKFYLENTKCEYVNTLKDKNILSILTYNVHSFININKDIYRKTNYFNIKKLVYGANTDIILLQEVFIHPNLHNKYIDDQKRKGYNIITSPNGLPRKQNRLFIVNLTKHPIVNPKKFDMTVYKYVRTCIISVIKGIKIAHVHLEMGYPEYRYLKGSKVRNDMEKINIDMRLDQLNNILDNKPDVIVGDFNFSYNDPEADFLREKGYINSGSKKSTNPYGTRTDMCFVKIDKVKIVSTETIQCNYSDHNPVVYNITKIQR